MTDGLGAGFAALGLLVVLGALAVVLVATAVGTAAADRRLGRVPDALRYLAVVLLAGVGAVGGFGVLALHDEAPAVAGLLVALVVAPLVAVVAVRRRTADRSWLDTLSVAGMAWGLPFVVGVFVAVGLNVAVAAVLGLAPAQALALGVAWVAAAGGGLVAVGGTLWLAGRLATVANA